MFRPLSLWQQIPCPALEARGTCTVTHCLFSHALPPPQAPLLPITSSPAASPALAVITTPSPTPSQSTDPRKQAQILPSTPKSSASTSTANTPTPPLPPPPPVTLLTGDPRLRKIIEANNAVTSSSSTSPDDTEDRRECKRRRVLDESTAPPTATPNTPTEPAVKRTKTKVETGGPVAAVAPKSILKKSSSTTTPTVVKNTNGNKIGTPSGKTMTQVPTAVARPLPLPKARVEEPAKPLSLNPRLVPAAPAKHEVRLKLLTLLHTEYVRLHGGAGDTQEMLRLALDEEEKVAREMKSIYSGAMKKRIVKLKNTSVADYAKEQAEKAKQVAQEEEERKRAKMVGGKVVDHGLNNGKAPLETGLTPEDELGALGGLLNSRTDLVKYKYILEPPTDEEILMATKGTESAGGWEACDRCSSRFQVFDGRRESDGQLASGGQCIYHWGRPAWPSRPLSGRAPKDNDRIYTCCRQRVGQSAGCTTCENHVYKISEPKRLASIWQFVKTPSHTLTLPEGFTIKRALCLDCEMCYTTQGMELIRLTATSFPSGAVIVDALVRPQGGILDLNSRYSGVFPKHLMEATSHIAGPYPPLPTDHAEFVNPTALSDPSNEDEVLPILSSPEAARTLLLSYIDDSIPIIGHALENDLNVLRLCHPTIIDTAILFPHVKGFPLRNKLKWLVERFLERRIQVDGDTPKGHDSKVDARCAGELVRWKIKETEVLKRSHAAKPSAPKPVAPKEKVGVEVLSEVEV